MTEQVSDAGFCSLNVAEMVAEISCGKLALDAAIKHSLLFAALIELNSCHIVGIFVSVVFSVMFSATFLVTESNASVAWPCD